MIEPKFSLTALDMQSQAWIKLSAYLGRRTERLRTELEGDRSDTDTAKLRGRLAEIKALIATVKEVPAAPE